MDTKRDLPNELDMVNLILDLGIDLSVEDRERLAGALRDIFGDIKDSIERERETNLYLRAHIEHLGWALKDASKGK